MPEEIKTQISMCRTTTGMGSIIGNATMIIRNFIKDLFPPNFFQDEFIDTQMIQTEFDKGNSENIVKKNKPCLVIRPKVYLDDDTLFGKLPDWTNSNFFIYKNLRRNYLPVLYDETNQIFMYSTGDRIKMSFEIEILLDTKLQQVNTAFFLKGSVLHKSYFYLNNMRMEAELPKYYMKQLAIVLNKDLANPNDRTEFNNYLNQHSQHFITEKIKLGSGNYSHFYLFSSNILCLFENNPEIDDGENQEMTLNNFKINETLTIEFFSPMTYFLEIGKSFKLIRPKDYDFISDVTNNKVSLHYTLNFVIPEKYKDMWYYNKIMYLTEDNPNIDIVDISDLFNIHDKEIIHFSISHKLMLDEIFHIDLYLDNNKVDEEMVIIDWNEFKLSNIKPKVNQSYTLVLYKSSERYNRVETVIDHLKGYNYN